MEVIKFIILVIIGLGTVDSAMDMITEFNWKEIVKFVFLLITFALIYEFL